MTDKSALGRRAFMVLWTGFIVAPIIAGADKFFHFLVDWHIYLSPAIKSVFEPHLFMKFVGIVEISVGLAVALRPRWAPFVLASWLLGIILNLLSFGAYLDVALRDFGLFLGAIALGLLARAYKEPA